MLFNLSNSIMPTQPSVALILGSLSVTIFTIALKDASMFRHPSTKLFSHTANLGHSLIDMVAIGSTIALALWMASMRLSGVLSN